MNKSDTRVERAAVLMRPEEWRIILDAANSLGMPMSTFLRSAGLEKAQSLTKSTREV